MEATRDSVKLQTTYLELDLDRLQSKDILSSDARGALEIAAFLEGFEIPDAPEFALWKDRQQARLLPFIKRGLLVLIDRCRRTGDSREVEQLADRLLLLDDLSEEATRAKMEARAVVGDRLTALKVFELWKKRLLEDLGAAPSEEVERMAGRLRRGGWERLAANEVVPPLPRRDEREAAFVGRASEYSLLFDLWDQVRLGRTVNVIIVGDSGVGKTTLAERLTKIATLSGASVARVQSYDLERAIPFATLSELTASLLKCQAASCTSTEALSELSRTVPEVREHFPGLPTAGDSQGESARLRLTEAFHELVSAIAEDHPLILVVDDLHQADEPSLAVLHLVLRRISGDRVMTIFTARPAELAQSHQATLLRDNLLRGGATELALGPLNEEATAQLLEALIEDDAVKPLPGVRRAMVAASNGFPMVLELLVHNWRSSGSASTTLALDAMTEVYIGGTEPLAAYNRILPRLTNDLDTATSNTLYLAAVLGHRLNDLSMYSIVDLTLGSTMAALGQLSQLRILRDGERGLEFVNELVRAHVYATIPSSVRKALHGSVADRLLHSKAHASTLGLEVAWHCMRSGRTAEAIPHLLQGARDAIKGGAPQSAELALSSAIPHLHGDSLSNAAILLVEAQQELGRWQESLVTIDSLKRCLDPNKSQEVFALAAHAKRFVSTPLDDWLEFIPSLRQIMEECPDTSSRIRAARAISHATSLLRDRAFAREMLEVVGRISTSTLDDEARGELGLATALLIFQAGDLDACFDYAQDLLEDLRSRGLGSSTVIQLRTGLGAVRGRQGRYTESATYHEDALRLADLIGNEHLSSAISANLSFCYGRLGRYDEQLACALRGQPTSGNRRLTFTDVQLASSVAFAYAATGRVESLRAVVVEFERQLGPQTERASMQAWLLWKSDALAVAGLSELALRSAVRAVRGYELRVECSAIAGVFARWMAITCSPTESAALLQGLHATLGDFDALDQVEILCAMLHCGLEGPGDIRGEAVQRIQALPDKALVALVASGIRH